MIGEETGMASKSIVGDLINFRGLVYSPLNEKGVVFLFGKVVEDLSRRIETKLCALTLVLAYFFVFFIWLIFLSRRSTKALANKSKRLLYVCIWL